MDGVDFLGTNILVSVERHKSSCSMCRHDSFIELEMVLKGKSRHSINGNVIEMEAGSVYLIRPQDMHEVKFLSESEIINISFAANFISSALMSVVMNSKSAFFYEFEGTERLKLASVFETVHEEYINRESFFQSAVRSGVEMIISMLLRRCEASEKKSVSDESIERAIFYIKTAFRENPSLEDVAGVVHLHPNYFSKKFCEYAKMSYKKYISNLKIAYAKRLLMETDMRVIDIGYASGFGSESNFMREFKKACGISAGEWRKKEAEAESTGKNRLS